jgi:hypothetical protein
MQSCISWFACEFSQWFVNQVRFKFKNFKIKRNSSPRNVITEIFTSACVSLLFKRNLVERVNERFLSVSFFVSNNVST